MNREYDAIVVGSGNGGLACANQLINSGKKVLLIEKHNLPGGVATSFVRGRFEFEVSLHELCDIGSLSNPGAVRQMLNSFGVNINFCQVPDTFRLISYFKDGRKIDATMPTGRNNFINAMEKYAPNNFQQMNTLFDLCEEIKQAVDYSSYHGVNDKLYFLKHFPNFVRCSSYSVNQVLSSLNLTQDAIDILGTYWSYLGIDCDHLSFMHYAIMFYLYVEKNAYIPQYTSHEITLALADNFIKSGGDLYYHTTCEKVLFDENKKVIGIKTNQGDFYSKNVIMNVNPSLVYATMIKEEIIPLRETKLANARTFSSRPFVVYLGLNKSYKELGIKDYTILFPSTTQSNEEYNLMKEISTNNYGIAICPNVVNESASEKGTCIITITTMFTSNCWSKIDIKEYDQIKRDYAKKLISLFEEKANVHIKEYIEEIDISTPWTYFRYASTPEGAAYGYETKDWDSILGRILSYEQDNKINGLYFVGGSSIYGDGYSTAYSNGLFIARKVLDSLKEITHEKN